MVVDNYVVHKRSTRTTAPNPDLTNPKKLKLVQGTLTLSITHLNSVQDDSRPNTSATEHASESDDRALGLGLGLGLRQGEGEGEGATTVPSFEEVPFDFALEAIFKRRGSSRAGTKAGGRGGGRAESRRGGRGRAAAAAPPKNDTPPFTRESPSRDDFRF